MQSQPKTRPEFVLGGFFIVWLIQTLSEGWPCVPATSCFSLPFHRALRQALQLAVEDEVLTSNPCQSIRGFKHQKPEPSTPGCAPPAWAAKQMGHSVELFLSTYVRWIDAGQDDKEVAKLEQSMADARADAQALKIASAGDD